MLIRNVVPVKGGSGCATPLGGPPPRLREPYIVTRFDRDGSSASAAAGERCTQGFCD